MENIVEYVVIALLIVGAFTILRFIWPLLLVIAIAIAAYMAYLRYKLNKELQESADFTEMNEQFSQYQQNQREDAIEEPIANNSVIDAEYTEKEVD